MVWSPDTYSCWYTISITVWCCWIERSDKGPKGPGDGILVSVVTQLGVTRPCVGRDPVWFSGMSIQRHSHVAMGSSLAWPFVGNPKKQYETCTVLVVEPASSGSSYSRHNIMVPMLAKIYIFTFEMFYTLCTSNNIKCFFLMRIKHLWLS